MKRFNFLSLGANQLEWQKVLFFFSLDIYLNLFKIHIYVLFLIIFYTKKLLLGNLHFKG